MGRGTPPQASAFSAAVKLYVRHLVAAEGGDLAGRSLARTLTRGATYYRDRLAGDKLYDTNDISDLARHFETTPHALVRAAIAHAAAVSEAAAKKGGDEVVTLADEWTLAAKRNVIDLEEEEDEGRP